MQSKVTVFKSGILRQATAAALAAVMLPISTGLALAQQEPLPAQGSYQQLPPDQIDQLVAPIALYPDSLVAQVLAAATYPQQVVSLGQFLQQNSGQPPSELAALADQQPWDPSVKSLVAFPQVVQDLNQNLDWTTQLGNAYFNQPQDVLGAVQVMRERAHAAGNLRTTPQETVNYAPGNIVIVPVSPEVVYVPYYNPGIIYGPGFPVYPHYHYFGPPPGVVFASGLALGFGVGLAIGAFSHFGWGFHSWAPSWGSHTVVYNHNTYISNSTTVINHGHYGGFDRSPQARAFNTTQNVRYGGVNRTTINNVTINRGGNTTINRGGNTFNNGGNTINRGGQTFNRGGQTFQNGNQTLNRGGQTFNRGNNPVPNSGQTFNRGSNPSPSAGQTFNRGTNPTPNGGQTFNRGAQTPSGTQQFNRAPAAPARPQGDFNRSQYAQQRPAAPAPQQHSAPQGGEFHGGGGGHEDHGGGHVDHGGGGGHEEHGHR